MNISEMQKKYPNMIMITEDNHKYIFIENDKYLYELLEKKLIDLTDCNNYDCLHKIAQINGSFIKKIYSSFNNIDGNIITDDYRLLYDKNKKPKLTDVERTILKKLDKEYEYIVRGAFGMLFISKVKPRKDKILKCWKYNDDIFPFKDLFQFIKWEDEEPYNIKELLKNAK